MTEQAKAFPRAGAVFALVVCATVLGIAGTDLVLPAVPGLPAALGGTEVKAQFVLAAFVAGTGLGLLLFGELGARFDQRWLLVGSLFAYALASAAAGQAASLDSLIVLRFVQGSAGSAAAVFAPGFIRAINDETHAIRAIGLLGSIESLVPALAPIGGAWLALHFGWRASFDLTAILALLLALVTLGLRRILPRVVPVERGGGYLALLGDPVYLRYALSQAFCLGGLLVIVFAAPTVLVAVWGGGIGDFILVQITGIAFFILGANLGGRLASRLDPELLILGGTLLAAAGAGGILLFAGLGGHDAYGLAALFVPMNLGFGLRGPPGFYRAIQAAAGDEARGAALVILAVLLAAAGGTAVAAPFIGHGLLAPALVAALIFVAAVLCLLLPRLRVS